jgi:hypothetical protein
MKEFLEEVGVREGREGTATADWKPAVLADSSSSGQAIHMPARHNVIDWRASSYLPELSDYEQLELQSFVLCLSLLGAGCDARLPHRW